MPVGLRPSRLHTSTCTCPDGKDDMPNVSTSLNRTFAVALIAGSLLLVGCNTTGTAPHSGFLMRSTASPAAAHWPQSESNASIETAEAVASNSPLLSTTCSPAFRMVAFPRVMPEPLDIEQVAASPNAESFQRATLPLMMASSSPAFLHRSRPVSREVVAKRPETGAPSPVATGNDQNSPTVTQTDAD